MRTLIFTSLALAGCMKTNPVYCEHHPEDTAHCPGMIDGSIGDGKRVDAPDAPSGCVGTGAFEVCPMGTPSGTITLSGTLDTDTSPMCQGAQLWKAAGQTPSCFITKVDITVTNLAVTGSKPLVLLAANEINVTGLLDIASHVAVGSVPGTTGPGVPATPCGNFPQAPANASGAGGGAAASLASAGGPGGSGGDGNNGAAAGGTKYLPFLASPPDVLRGGCNGQTGGMGMGNGGTGGYGGGAIYLAAGGTISMGASGIINASGAGGSQAAKSAGGGGGGSGGMIILWAPSFNLTAGAKLVANGGSGSSGGDSNGPGLGTAGNDPDPTNPMTPALGGNDDIGGDGGNGFAQGSLGTAGNTGPSSAGGGGGGGAGGYIQANMALANATASPTANVP